MRHTGMTIEHLRRRLRVLTGSLAWAAVATLVLAQATPVRHAGLDWDEVLRLKDARDYFTLRERLETAGDERAAAARFARAVLQQAFNEPAASRATITALVSLADLPAARIADLRLIEMDDDLRLFDYRAGLAVANRLLDDPTGLTAGKLKDAQNTRRMFEALDGAQAQTAQIPGDTTIKMTSGRIPVIVNGSSRDYVFDTGANLSTIMRSEARALGIRVVTVGLDVGTATDRRVSADLGVAERVTIGKMTFSNVVFLVLDDAQLTFPDGFRIPGIVGFPVIEQMGEVRISRQGGLTVPAAPPRRAQRNLALEGLTLLTRVRWDGQPLLCMVDSGAGKSQFFEPFYSRYRERIDPVTRVASRKIGGAGGIREMNVRPLDARLEVAGTSVARRSFDVLLQPIVTEATDNYLDCSIGHDILDSASEYILNFRDMAFVLR